MINHAHEGHQPIGLLGVTTRLGEDDDIAFVTLLVKKFQRNRIGQPTIEQLLSIDFNILRHQRHRGRSANPFAHLIHMHALCYLFVDGFARFHIGSHKPKRCWMGIKGLKIKRIELFWHLVVTKIGTKQVARAEP